MRGGAGDDRDHCHRIELLTCARGGRASSDAVNDTVTIAWRNLIALRRVPQADHVHQSSR